MWSKYKIRYEVKSFKYVHMIHIHIKTEGAVVLNMQTLCSDITTQPVVTVGKGKPEDL